MYQRFVELKSIIKHKSLFLLGPRQTGKSTYLKQLFNNARYFDLLESDLFRELSAFPETLRQSLKGDEKLIIIDEVQKLPSLLDEVQLLIDRNKNLRFILTGSSPRKLKRGQANLLGGRAWFVPFHPLTTRELNFVRIQDQLIFGGLPGIIDSPYAFEDLKAYVGTYLQEEIQAEGFSRKIENFSRFLSFAAYINGEQVNFTKIGNDAQIPSRTIKDYFSVLEDTLLAYILPAYQKTRKRKPVATAKFYLFDVGVANALQGRKQLLKNSTEYGKALEHLVCCDLRAYLDYSRCDLSLCYWRSQSKHEVDFIIGDAFAIEVKGTTRVANKDLRGLKALAEEIPLKRKIVVCNEERERVVDDIEIIPNKLFFQALWNNEIIT
ncbi:MAG: ATP-binding protein [Deltaproteobacteria bacterium]|nr:ATP-binding protein [Deltaproteobacteria bacterium]